MAVTLTTVATLAQAVALSSGDRFKAKLSRRSTAHPEAAKSTRKGSVFYLLLLNDLISPYMARLSTQSNLRMGRIKSAFRLKSTLS
jgi:hypothetical protein